MSAARIPFATMLCFLSLMNHASCAPGDTGGSEPRANDASPIRLMLYDRTCRGRGPLPGLTHAWSFGGVVYNLLGRIEFRSQMGSMITDFSMIKAGALHRANGGYLILNATQVLSSPSA